MLLTSQVVQTYGVPNNEALQFLTKERPIPNEATAQFLEHRRLIKHLWGYESPYSSHTNVASSKDR